MSVVDSSGWLAWFADGPSAQFFAPAILAEARLLVLATGVHEVYKRILVERGEDEAFEAMADSLMYATALGYEATFWIQDADFAAMPGVRYVRRAGPATPP